MIREKEIMNALMTLTMMFFLNVIKITGDCPRYCECKWKSGKESVLCTNANMTEIPKHLDSGTQLLDLTGNRLQSIGSDEFFNASLLNLQKIFLSRCRLRFIERSSFRKIINLVELDLSYNELHSVPSHTFEFITELRELRLNGNPIIRVLNNAFKMVPRLTKLDLSECRIGYVEIKAFQGLETSLEWLKLDKNKIMNIKSIALVNLGNLHGLELSGNPWNCSCGLRTLREWMLRQNVPYSIPPVCKYPSRLADKDWDKLDVDEFACTPRIEAVSSLKSGEEGSNVTMSCTVHGNPEPRIRWLKKNHPIVNMTAATNLEKPKLYIVQIAKESSNLTILAADVQDNGVYVCRAENKAGKSEANITLTITIKSVVRIWSSRMIAAVGAVSLLFAVAVGLLTFCAWSSRKRKFDFGHPVGRRDYDADGYEMSHKKPINYNKIVDYGNHYRSNSTTHTSGIPGKNSRTGSSNERTIQTSQEGNNQLRDFFASQSSGSGSRDERIWDSLKTSDVEDRLSKSSNSRLSPDLHIPRLNEHESHRNSPTACKTNTFLEDSSTTCKMASSQGFLSFNPNIEPRFSHPDKARDGTHKFYDSQPKQRTFTHVKYPDLLELSKNTENLLNNNNNIHNHKNNNNINNNNNNNSCINSCNNNNNNLFCTMPRKRSYKIKKNRYEAYGSESQSPLLPGSSGDSCDSNYSSSRRPSIELDSTSKNVSLPASPGNLHQPSMFNAFDGSPDYCDKLPKTLKYKSWELENFLKEYRSLQDQLCKMKESCENLNEETLKYRESGSDTTAAENVAPSKLISYATTSESLYSVNKKFFDDSHNAEALYGKDVFATEEDNNNPKSILKNKKRKSQAETAVPGGIFCSSDNKMLETLTEPNSENPLYQS